MFSSRMAIRWAHIVAALYNVLFVYTPLHQWEYGFPVVQYISMPVLLLTGLHMVRKRRQHHAMRHAY